VVGGGVGGGGGGDNECVSRLGKCVCNTKLVCATPQSSPRCV